MVEVHILNFNIRGLMNKTRRLKISNYLKRLSTDIILIQEARVLNKGQGEWKMDWGFGEVCINPLKINSGGQINLIKNRYQWLSHEAISQDRLILRLFDQNIKMWNIHSPNDPRDQAQYFRILQEKLHNEQTEGHAIVVDFRLVLNTHIDKSGGMKVIVVRVSSPFNNVMRACRSLKIISHGDVMDVSKEFWDVLWDKLVDTLNYSKVHGELALSQRRW